MATIPNAAPTGHARTSPSPRPRVRWLGVAIGLSIATRIAAAMYLGHKVTVQPGIADQVSYDALAIRVLNGHGFTFAADWWPATRAGEPTAHWSYAYVLFLAGVYGAVGHAPLAARLLQAVVAGTLQPLLTYRITAAMFGDRAAIASAFVIACYGYFAYYGGALMTESLCIVALLWSVSLALRIGRARVSGQPPASVLVWALLGLALALAVLLRQAMLFIVPVVLGWCTWQVFVAYRVTGGPRRALATVTAGVLAAGVVIAAVIAPWTLRNQRAFGEFVLLNTNAGYAFYWGNHPIHGTSFVPILREESYGQLIPDELRSLNEAQLDKALLRRGLAFATDDPWRYARLSLSRTPEFIKFWPSGDSGLVSSAVRVLSFGLLLPAILAGIWLALRKRPTPAAMTGAGAADDGRWLLLAIAAVYSVLHLLTWTLVRYRLPVDAVLMPFAGLSISVGWSLLGNMRNADGGSSPR